MELNREQIIKALECCVKEKPCRLCPLNDYSHDADDCKRELMKHALALYRELTAENKRLEREVDRLSQVVLYHERITEMEVVEAKADTVQKFAERLKDEMDDVARCEFDGQIYFCVGKGFVDKIAQEMLEGENESNN